MTTEHTPTTWSKGGEMLTPAGYLAIDTPHENDAVLVCCEELRDQIILEHNAHDALLEALEKLIEAWNDGDYYCCHHQRLGRDDHAEDCCVGMALPALARARGSLR